VIGVGNELIYQLLIELLEKNLKGLFWRSIKGEEGNHFLRIQKSEPCVMGFNSSVK